MSRDLLALSAEFRAHTERGEQPEDFVPSETSAVVRDGRVLIDATAHEDGDALLRELAEIGMTEGTAYGRMVSGWLPLDSVPSLQSLQHLRLARPSVRATGGGVG